ncbi:MAG: hypothetical protein V3R76_00345 [Gammaproteobacteria bacterium]
MALHDTWDGNWDGFEVKKEAVDWSEFTPVDEPEPEPKPGSLFTDNQIVPDTEYTDEGWMQSANQQRGVDKIATKGVTAAMGLAEIAARQDPTPSSLILDEAKDFSPWTFSPIAAITNAMSSILVKETVDVVDMFTEGDIRKEVIDASQLIREDSARILGNPNIQYQGNAGTRFGYEVMEAAVNMGGALMVGYVTRNRGLALGVIGAQVGGGTYQDYMVKTKGDHDKSMLAAKFHVVAEVLPETIPVFAMLRKTKVGEGVTRMLEATIGEGVQEMLTSILTQAYDNKQLENMSLKEAILGIDWGNVLYEGAIGVFVGATLSAPGAMGDYLEGRRQGEGPPPDTTLDDELTPDFQIKTLEDNADVIGDLIEQIPELPKPSGDVADKGEGWVDVDAELEEGDAELKQWAEEKARELSQEKPKELGLDAPESVKLADDAGEEKPREPTILDKARAGDKKAQKMLSGYDLGWEGNKPKYRMVGKDEADKVLAGEAIKPTRNETAIDVTDDPDYAKVPAGSDRRITFKQSSRFDTDLGKDADVREKNAAAGEYQLIGEYSLEDIETIEQRQEDGTWKTIHGEKETDDDKKRAAAVVDIKAKLEGEGIEFGGPPKPAEKLEKASETISNDALKAVDAALEGFPKDITDLSGEKHDELIKLIKSRRDIVDQIDHGLSPRKTSEERTRLIKELHAQNKTPRKYATISDMMEQLGGVGAPSKPAEITPAEVKAATEPVEPTGEAIKAAEDFREVRPEFKGLILSFKPGDDRDGRPTPNFYGEIADTEDADGMPIDVVLSKDFVTDVEDPVFIINQKDWDTGEFRQHKVMAGFAEMAEAEQSFFDQWGESGWGSTHELTAEEFQEWLDSGDHKAEYAPAEMVKIGERLRKKYDLPKAAGNQIIHNAAYGPNVKPGSDEAKWRKWFEEGGAKEITPVADEPTEGKLTPELAILIKRRDELANLLSIKELKKFDYLSSQDRVRRGMELANDLDKVQGEIDAARKVTTKKATKGGGDTPVADYYTTPGARELNHKFKDGDPKAITKMASQMAGNVKPGQVLVPMPDRTGKAGNTLKLAKEIAKITGNPVKNLLSGNDRESWYETKKKGKTAPDFGFKVKGKVPENTLIIDNVYDTGETMKQAQKALGGSEYLVHSKVDTPTAKKVAKGGGDTPVGDTQTRAIAAVGDKEYKKRVAAAIKDRRAEDNADWIKEKITRSAGINILAEEFRKTEAGKDLPEPNDHGVYPDEAAERLSYNPKTKVNRAKVDLDVLQLADGIWALGYDYKSRNAGSSSGISASETYETRDEAFVSGLQGAKRHFTQVVDSTLTTTSKVEKAEGKKVLKWVDAELEKFPAQAEKKSTAKKVAKGGGDTPVGDSTLALGDIVRTKDGDIGKILKFTYVNPKAVVNLIPGGPIADYLNDSLTLLPDGVPERAQIAAGGKAVKIFIPSTGAEIKAKLTVVSGKDLIPSHDKDGAVNPEYPEQLQPRDRKKGASRIQIGKMSSNLKPELLADSGSVDSGSPIIGTDGIVESGNARTLAILKAYEKGKAKKYLAYLRKNAESYGLTKADINAMEHPVLVRVRQGKMTMTERAEFARLANESGTAPMTPAETAKADAARITDDDMKVYAPSDDGNILAPSNRSFLTTFGSRLGDLASGGMTTTDGGWTKQFADRVQAAVFHKAYENEALLALMAEEADPGIKNILAALGQAAPAFARARSAGEMGDLDLIADMVTAIELIKQTNVQGASIDQLLNQEDMFGGVDPAVGKIAKFIEDNIRSAKKLGEGFSKMAAGLEAEMAQQQQEGLFDLPPISKSDLVPESEAEPAAGQSDEELELHELSVEDHIKELEKAVFVEGRSDAWLTPSTRNKDGVESEKSISRYEKGLRDVGWESFIKGKGDFWRKDGAELFLRSQGTLSSPLVQFTAPTPEQEAADFKEEIGEVAADPRVKSEKVVLIACCKQKGEKAAPARELYKSPLFKTRLEYAESLNPDRILILSAKHGLLELDQVIEPYDISMKGKSPEEKRNWARVAYNKISTMLQPTGSEFIFLTGKDYRTELSKLLGQHPDAKITVPFEGLGIGAQLMDMKRANAESDKAGLKIVKGEGSRNPESGDLWVAADHVLKTVWGVGRTKQQATEDAQEAIDDWDGDTPKLSFLRIPFETDVDGYFDGKPGELYDLAMSPDQIQPASKKTEAKTKPVAKSEEWVTPFAKDEYKPGDRVEIIEDGSGSVDFTDDDGKIWVTLDSANVMDKGVSFTPEELRHEEDFSKRPSPFKTIDDVLRASAQAGGVYNSLTNIKLTADTGKKKIVHTAEYWLNAIDSRIKAMNELRGCAK